MSQPISPKMQEIRKRIISLHFTDYLSLGDIAETVGVKYTYVRETLNKAYRDIKAANARGASYRNLLNANPKVKQPYYENELEIIESLKYSEKSPNFNSFVEQMNNEGTRTYTFSDAVMVARIRPETVLQTILGGQQQGEVTETRSSTGEESGTCKKKSKQEAYHRKYRQLQYLASEIGYDPKKARQYRP